METIYQSYREPDVHGKNISDCFGEIKAYQDVMPEVKVFNKMANDLVNLSELLQAKWVSHVTLNSTRVYWKLVRIS